MSLSIDEVRHIAWLARLAVTDEEVERFRAELSVILDHFSVLQTLNTDEVPAQECSAGRLCPPFPCAGRCAIQRAEAAERLVPGASNTRVMSSTHRHTTGQRDE